MDTKRMALFYAAAARARGFFNAQAGGYVVVSGLTPIRHVEIPGRSIEWATLDPWVIAPSCYAGADDAAADLATTAIKPDGLKPMAINDWYPAYVRAVRTKIEALEAMELVR